ncbi:MAG: hypothetical protein B7X99_02695 [Rhizobiales bacterium 17-65-6]|nr:MAG: hypothetical protein B7Y84_06755 [Azorhizobium sp. 32-67-21]OZA00863.1 MAG: hypothetical protein B7X99_02695 [Rhizobiales bacterium 17-65-6]
MALAHLSIIALGLLFSQLTDEAISEQVTLANLLAAASEAQDVCALPGEAFQMMTFVRQVQPAFDVVNDPGDARAVSAAVKQVKASIRKVGAKAWCELYLRERLELFRSRALPACDEMPGLCRSMRTVKDGLTGQNGGAPLPAEVRPEVVAVSL